MWAELVDFTIMAAASALGPLILAFRLASTGNTPGLRWAGFTGVRTSTGQRPGFFRALCRQVMLLLCGLPLGVSIAYFVAGVAGRVPDSSSVALGNFLITCVLWLPWLIVSPLLIGMTRSHRNLYDILSGTAPVGHGREPLEAQLQEKTGAPAPASFSSKPGATLPASSGTSA